MTTLSTAYAIGAMVIEKHFTDDKNRPEMIIITRWILQTFVIQTNSVQNTRRDGKRNVKKPLDSEEISRKNARRSIVINTDIKKEKEFQKIALTYKRPAAELAPSLVGSNWKNCR